MSSGQKRPASILKPIIRKAQNGITPPDCDQQQQQQQQHGRRTKRTTTTDKHSSRSVNNVVKMFVDCCFSIFI